MKSEKGCCSSHGLTNTSSPSLFRVGESAFLLLSVLTLDSKKGTKIPRRSNCNLNTLPLQQLFQDLNVPSPRSAPILCCTAYNERSVGSHISHELKCRRHLRQFIDLRGVEFVVCGEQLDDRIWRSAACGFHTGRWALSESRSIDSDEGFLSG